MQAPGSSPAGTGRGGPSSQHERDTLTVRPLSLEKGPPGTRACSQRALSPAGARQAQIVFNSS